MSGAPPRRAWVSTPALAAVLFWGASFPAVSVALESFHPFGLVLVRMLLGASLLAVLLLLRGDALLPRRADRAASTLLGLVLGAHILIQAFAMRFTSAMLAGWIVAFMPAVIALFGRLFKGQRLSGGAWLGIAVASGGVALVTSSEPPRLEQAGLGDALMFVSCFTWAAYCTIAPRPVARSGSLPVTTWAMAAAALLCLPFAFGVSFAARPVTAGALGSALFLGLLCSGTALVLWNHAVSVDGPARAGALLYLQPFVTLAVAVFGRGESVTWQALAGGPIVLAGVWLVHRRPSAPTDLASPAEAG
jgi:drug/metabolite transporter (DMT)-like permease